MATEHVAGTQNATIDTEHVLNTTTPDLTDGAFQLIVDTDAMVDGDSLTLRIKEKAISGGAQRILWTANYRHAQARPLTASPPVILIHGWDMTLEQTAGTGRAFPWSIRKA